MTVDSVTRQKAAGLGLRHLAQGRLPLDTGHVSELTLNPKKWVKASAKMKLKNMRLNPRCSLSFALD